MTDNNLKLGKAAIWFAMDGYSTAKGVNGRRIAGESFLRGYLRHSRADRLATYAASKISINNFQILAKEMGNVRPVDGATFDSFKLPGDQTNLYLPTPNIGREAWHRARIGHRAYSISGVTHTISTERVLRAFMDLRTGPVMPWDAVICTSKAVYDSVQYQFDDIDRHLHDRFGSVPERFQLPIIPLGINTDEFEIKPGRRQHWRKVLGIPQDDLVVVSVARLSSFEKFDPLPMFMAMQAASKSVSQNVHLIALGQFSDNVAKKMFNNGVRTFAPDITLHHVDGAVDPAKREALAAADIFALPVENIQETFGLSPVEAMAAGLPVVVTDWNGFRDNVTPDCGFLIKTIGPTPGSMGREAERYEGSLDSYNQFIGLASQMTAVDINQMTQAFSALFSSKDLRAKMGAAGQKRARNHLDWKQIIPQYEDLWAELDAIRNQAKSDGQIRRNMPIVPDPTLMFANYATELFDRNSTLRISPQMQGLDDAAIVKKIQTIIDTRGLNSLKRKTASLRQYISGLQAIASAPEMTFADLVMRLEPKSASRAERLVLWYLKYDLVELVKK